MFWFVCLLNVDVLCCDDVDGGVDNDVVMNVMNVMCVVVGCVWLC